jgi:hypothetical protein
MSHDPDEFRFRQYAEGHASDSPVDLSGREGAPRTTCLECADPLDADDIANDVGRCKECRVEDAQRTAR